MTYDPNQAPAQRPAGTNTYAIISLVLGVLSIVSCGCLAGIPAIILGHMAQNEVRATGQEGEGLAKAGIILGWISIALAVLGIIVYALFLGSFAFLSQTS